MRARRFALAAVVSVLATGTALAGELKDGAYKVAGTDAEKGAYTGEVRIARTDATHVSVRGVYVLKGGTLQSFAAKGTTSAGKLTFAFDLKSAGIIDRFTGLFTGRSTKKVTATYTVGDGSAHGTWAASNDTKFKRTDAWTLLATTIERVEPSSLAAGASRIAVTLVGKDLPLPADLARTDVAFTLAGADDAKVSVVSIGERSDDGTRLKLTVTVDKTAGLGKRGARVLGAKAADVVSIVPRDLELPLGGTADLGTGQTAKLVIPLGGGTLKLSTTGGTLKLTTSLGAAVPGDFLKTGIALANPGEYTVRVEGGQGTVTSSYAISGETRPENKPYNFWYFPFYERQSWSSGLMNLYADGGVYEKVDAIFGPMPTGAEKFQEWRHMDAVGSVSTTTYAFKMPTDAVEKARYEPTTAKGFAWCYQRSKDPDKSWWGHCWGAVIAESLHRAPQAKTVSLPEGALINSQTSVKLDDEELEGILSSYYSNHNVDGNFFINSCPPGRPTEKADEPCDRYAADLWRGLVEGIKKQGVPVASNLRAESTSDTDNTQVWNHAIWKFEAQLKRVPGQDDAGFIEFAIKVFATNDVFPSAETQSPRTEDYVIRLRTKAGAVVPNAKDQNWVSASHFCPSYLARLTSSTSGDAGCENEVLGMKVGIKKLVEKLGYQKNQ